MVVIHLKRSSDLEFLHDCTTSLSVDELSRDLALIVNMLHRLVAYSKELAEFGPAKPLAEQGLDEEMAKLGVADKGKRKESEFYKADPTGRRTGDACGPEAAQTLIRTCDEALSVASTKLVAQKRCLTMAALEEALQNIKGATMIAFPQGLPEWDPVRHAIEDREDLTGTQASKDVLDPATCQLWWAQKPLDRGQSLSKYIGKNEKQKLIAKLQKKGAGQPVKEPPLDEEGQKRLMAFYYKKQEEDKRLAADGDPSYADAAWANPKALRQAFSGTGGDISWKGGR